MCARRALCTTEPSLLQTLVKGKQNDFMLLTLSSLFLIEASSVVPMGSWGPGALGNKLLPVLWMQKWKQDDLPKMIEQMRTRASALCQPLT